MCIRDRAHTALGGDMDALEPVLTQREADVQEVIQSLRELHLAASRRELAATTLPQINDVVERLRAEEEVDAAARRRKNAAAAARKLPH